MFQKTLILTLALLVSSCGLFSSDSKGSGGSKICPVIEIKPDILEVSNGSISVRLKGYEGYCYYNDNIKDTVAIITPIFEATRKGSTDESDIHLAYYTETLKGPPKYLGRKTYYTYLDFPTSHSVKEIKGKTSEVRVPKGLENTFSINLGLVAKKRNSI
jgi:hypothetical protein